MQAWKFPRGALYPPDDLNDLCNFLNSYGFYEKHVICVKEIYFDNCRWHSLFYQT